MRHKRKEAPVWVFSWRPLGESPLRKWFAALLVGGVFAVLLTSVRIRVTPPTPWAARKAAVIQVANDAEGRALTLRAREGGPFPSRFDPAEWRGTAALEEAAFETARWTPPPYVPALRELPEVRTPPVLLAAKGEPVFPKREPGAEPAVVPANLKLAPVIYPRSGITAASIPRELPPFEGAVTEKITAETWHMLVRLDTAGTVLECVSLAGNADVDLSALEDWLRRVTFNPEPAKASRWIAVGVGFTNQADGTDAR